MRELSEMGYLRDLTRVIHYRGANCCWVKKDSTITDNEGLVSCRSCLKKNKKTLNKPAFLELLKKSIIIKEGIISVVRLEE